MNVRQESGRPGFNPRSSYTKDSKNSTWCRLALSTLRWRSRVKWSNPGSGIAPLHLGVVAIVKGTFGSPSTKVVNFIYFLVIPRSLFFGKGRMLLFVHFSFVFWLYTALNSRSYRTFLLPIIFRTLRTSKSYVWLAMNNFFLLA